jgi:uncharacterized membrane protein YraQ (UPF0718 family)
LDFFREFSDHVRPALEGALDLYLDAAPFLLVGCLLGGLVYAFFPGRIVERWLGGRGARSILGAALVGTPLPLCSCGVVPTAMTLRRRGASTGATVAFVVATPETGPDSLLVSFALFDPLFAIFRPIAAIFTAVAAGLLAAVGERAHLLPQLPPQRICEICDLPDEGEHRHGVAPRLSRAMSYATCDLVEDVGGWLLIGVLVGGVLTSLVRPEWVHTHLPSRWLQMVAAMVVGVPMYVCASASTPLAAAAVLAGFSPGAALVFMLTGPATNVASLLLLRKELGSLVVVLMLVAISAASLLCGALLDALYDWTGWKSVVHVGPPAEHLPLWLRAGCGVLLAALIVAAWWRQWRGVGRKKDCATCSVPHVHSDGAHRTIARPHEDGHDHERGESERWGAGRGERTGR